MLIKKLLKKKSKYLLKQNQSLIKIWQEKK